MYRRLAKQHYDDPEHFSLVPIRKEDMESIRLWRNAQTTILRQNDPISALEQEAYFTKVLAPSFEENEPKQILFSFLHIDHCIGYGGLTHIDFRAKRAELSFLLDPTIEEGSPEFATCFSHFFSLLQEIAFQELKFHRLVAETYATRRELIALLELSGFEYEGCLKDHVFKNGVWIDSLMYGLVPHVESKKAAVLITSCSKKVPLIQAVRNAIAKTSDFGYVYGCDSNEFVISRYFVDHFWHSKPFQELKCNDIIEYCLKHSIKAIIPTRDAELDFFAKNRPAFEKKGIFVLVSEPETIAITQDKKRFSDYLQSKNFPSIPTYLTLSECPEKTVVVKERFGAASHGIGLKLTHVQAEIAAQSLKNPIFQPYIEGVEYSVDLYRDRKGALQGIIARYRDVIAHGESEVTTTTHKPELEALCNHLADELNLYGHAVIQVIEDRDGKFHILECNPRFGGASTSSLHAGLESFYWFLLESQKKDTPLPSFKRLSHDIRQVRHPQDRLFYTW